MEFGGLCMRSFPLLAAMWAFAGLIFAQERAFNTWSQYLGGADSSQYSALKQINKGNVKQLEIAWTYPTSEPYLFNPIVVDGTMYVQAKNNSLVALDAVSGRELWTHAFQGAVTTRASTTVKAAIAATGGCSPSTPDFSLR